MRTAKTAPPPARPLMSSDELFKAQSLHRDGDFAAASLPLQDILEQTPNHVAAWRLRAYIFRELEHSDDAAKADKKGNVIEANHTADVGSSLFLHGDLKRGRVFFERSLALDPTRTGPQQVAGTHRVLRSNGVGPIVDMGCGTGLGGLAVQVLVGPMIGIDLLSEMLGKAKSGRSTNA